MIYLDDKKSKKDKKDKKDKIQESTTTVTSSVSNGHEGGDIIQPEKTAPRIDTSRWVVLRY